MANGNSVTRVVTPNSTGVSCNHPDNIELQDWRGGLGFRPLQLGLTFELEF